MKGYREGPPTRRGGPPFAGAVIPTHAAELVIRCLENEGAAFAFGIPGEENLDLMDALHDASVRFVLARHEEAAAFMADVHGRLTGRAGVCLSTLGPGATNLVTGIADAFLDRAPLVALTAQEPLSLVHKESHQYVDIVRLLAPVTKWNARVEDADAIPEILRKAFKIAEAEKPGSTHVELPVDVAEATTKARPIRRERTRRPSPDRPSLERAAKLLAKARRPMILAGNGVIRGGASEALTRLAEGLRIPVACTFMGKGAIPWTSPMSLLTIGLQAYDYEHVGFNKADLVLCIGYDIVEYDPAHWNPKADQTIVHIDVTPAEVSAYYVPEVEIVADIRESVDLLRERCAPRREAKWTEDLRTSVLERLEPWREGRTGFAKPPNLLRVLREAMGPDDLLISDVGAHKIWVGRFFQAVKPNTVLISNGLATMGIALPGGIAAKLTQPDRRVVTLSGDGGFLMMVHELETMKREKAATVNLVWRDGGLGSIRWKQKNKFGRTLGVDFGNPDLRELAKAFGIRGYRADKAGELTSILEEALGRDEPCLVDIPVDYSDNPFLVEAMGRVVARQ